MKTLYKIWCEYDLGLEDYVYESEELAANGAREVWESDEQEESLEDLEEAGLFYVTEVYLITDSSEE